MNGNVYMENNGIKTKILNGSFLRLFLYKKIIEVRLDVEMQDDRDTYICADSITQIECYSPDNELLFTISSTC